MKRLLLLIFLPAFLHANWDQLFNQEDPALFHHVNVISGTLNVCMQDTLVKGAESIPLFRTYSTTINNPREDEEKFMKLHRGFYFRGGWTLFPHVNMYVGIQRLAEETSSDIRVYIPESNGSMITYIHEDGRSKEKKFKKFSCLVPEKKIGQFSGEISARNNPENNTLDIQYYKGKATLKLANNGRRKYEIFEITSDDSIEQKEDWTSYYHLVKEYLPSGRILLYSYDKKGNLTEIICKDAKCEQTLSSLTLRYESNKHMPFRIEVNTSDRKIFQYIGGEHKRKNYLMRVNRQKEQYAKEEWQYEKVKEKQVSRVKNLELSGREQMQLTYYPCEKKKNKKGKEYWDRNENSDKVQIIEAPIGINGEMEPIAYFDYHENYTEVKDVEGVYTRYHHKGGRITEIEYLDQNKEKHLSEKFHWKDDRLIAKTQLTPDGMAYFSKTMEYDQVGNVTKETLWGNFSGLLTPPFEVGENGELIGAEQHSKVFTYDDTKRLVATEQEEGGPLIKSWYKHASNLLTRKFVYADDTLVQRTFHFYSDGNHLMKEITDDGSGDSEFDLSDVTRRLIKTYDFNATGLPRSVSESYWDPETGKTLPLKRNDFRYSASNDVIEERIYDTNGDLRNTIHTDYDDLGRVIRKVNSLGQESTYSYTPYGELEESKEPGSPKKTYTYDSLGRPLSSTAAGKTTYTSYDAKGRLIEKIDEKGNVTRQNYDCFGHCLETDFPSTLDENQQEYIPTLIFGYDLQGNLITSSNPRGEETCSEYNVLRKPTREIQSDGAELRHIYNTNGSIAETHYSDGTKILQSYDIFGRITSKSLFSSEEELLSEESWAYDIWGLIAHTDPRGLTTHYSYDGAGRKIAEEAGGRTITYAYDALGNLERTTQGEITHVQIHDAAGRVIEEWDEDRSINQAHIYYTYDNENRKIQAEKRTHKGNIRDLFTYDEEGRLTSHTDPLEEVTRFIYDDAHTNALGQTVLRKITIDPLGNRSVEEFDVAGRLVHLEKQNPKEETVSFQSLLYDRAGNRVRREITIYLEGDPQTTHITRWEYDLAGRVTREIEQETKTTEYRYDIRGRLIEKILPSGESLSYTYDGLDRTTSLISSDGTIHHSYIYQGMDLIEAHDHITSTSVFRTYNPFGQILSEVDANGHPYRWEYDEIGRCTRMTLPDGTPIDYEYKGLYLKTVSRPKYRHQYLAYDSTGHVTHEELAHKLGLQITEHDKLERPIFQDNPFTEQSITYGPSGLVISYKKNQTEKSYSYDSLNQLRKEGDTIYLFDSIGNPTNFRVNSLNQITTTPTENLFYDPNGNLTERQSENAKTYTYDPLGRLTSISTHETTTRFHYDPFSRLIALTTPEKTTHFIYDQDREIGSITPSGKIQELKVLGLGLKGDIGAAIAIELGDEIYAPLHDFNGNITDLISISHTLVGSCEYTAFGQESAEISPWGFCSKRKIHGLIYFGMRFYDPDLGRWITPDPAGDIDSANLYLYVLNSPQNRLDLFGLYSENSDWRPPYGLFPMTDQTGLYTPRYNPYRYMMHSVIPTPISARWLSPTTSADTFVTCGHWQKLQYSAEERKVRYVNLLDHFHELLPKEGAVIGLNLNMNGIVTKRSEFRQQSTSVTSLIPEGTFTVSMYNPTAGLGRDLMRSQDEMLGFDTPIVLARRQFLETTLPILANVNPKCLVLSIDHSEASLIERQAIAGMTPEGKALAKKHLICVTVGGAKPMPLEYTYQATNYYSKKDYFADIITVHGRVMEDHRFRGSKVPKNLSYDIRYVKCITPRENRTGHFADHNFLGETYQKALKIRCEQVRREYGFYGKSR